MNKTITIAASLLVLAFLWTGCKRETLDTSVAYGYSYFPLDQGRYWIWQVDSVVYDDYFNTVDTNSFQIKEVINGTNTDNLGRTTQKIDRYIRSNSNAPWSFLNVWQTLLTDNRAERIEGNQRLIKLAFPVLRTQNWNGNAYVDFDTLFAIRGSSIDIYKDWESFYYNEIDKPFELNGVSYDSTLFVEQVNSENNIELRYSVERYARHVGMIYKQMKILDTQCGDPVLYPNGIADCLTVPWEIKAEKGFILTYTLLEHN